jgi:carbon storage regulator
VQSLLQERGQAVSRRDQHMLVLTRKTGEAIRIGDNINVTVVKVQGNRVRIGIEAPRSVEVNRAELTFWHEGEVEKHEAEHALT